MLRIRVGTIDDGVVGGRPGVEDQKLLMGESEGDLGSLRLRDHSQLLPRQ